MLLRCESEIDSSRCQYSGLPPFSYTRGSDLSGSLEGAGGIGGLLARTGNEHSFYHADGNGNVTYLETSAQGLGASYRYDAFGNTTASSGSLASANSYRFSSKMVDALSGLYYYGYRWYAPNLQRWMSRDPIGEADGPNLYGFIHNSPISFTDKFGLYRDCSAESIACNRACMKVPSPYETCDDSSKMNKWKRTEYCQALCQRAYMLCEAENAVEAAENAAKKTLKWCWQHPVLCAGGVIIIIIAPETIPIIAL